MRKKKFYITTTLPYVNSTPHIGFALEIVQADVVARYHSLLGEEVFFNFGTDEHGQKIYQKAVEEQKDPQKYTDEYAAKFDNLKKALNLSYNNFIRTTDPHHKKAAVEIWNICLKNGFIEKGIYTAKYCVGCELEKQDSELEGGKCPIHPNLLLQQIKEENYFFKFSKFQNKLLALYKKYPDFVIPAHRLKEITNFVKSGLADFSVSRLKEKMPWGVPVPNDHQHVMYVWFDALTNYISALGWPENKKRFADFWGTIDSPNALQVAGKDNLRQQSAMWQAMLLAAGLPPSRQIFIHGFITSGGAKMSKSMGNVIDPFSYAEKYGTDALRYYLLAKISPTEDSDFTKEKFEEVYNGDLANGLGNLVARVAKLCEQASYKNSTRVQSYAENFKTEDEKYFLGSDSINDVRNDRKDIANFKFDSALRWIWIDIDGLNQKINNSEPWKLLKKQNTKLFGLLEEFVQDILNIGLLLQPLLPETAEKIIRQFSSEKIVSQSPLFPRLK